SNTLGAWGRGQRRCKENKGSRKKYNSAPPSSANTLMINGVLMPCQIAKLYSGSGVPKVACAAAANTGPTANAGAIPTAKHSSTKSSTGKRVTMSDSCG